MGRALRLPLHRVGIGRRASHRPTCPLLVEMILQSLHVRRPLGRHCQPLTICQRDHIGTGDLRSRLLRALSACSYRVCYRARTRHWSLPSRTRLTSVIVVLTLLLQLLLCGHLKSLGDHLRLLHCNLLRGPRCWRLTSSCTDRGRGSQPRRRRCPIRYRCLRGPTRGLLLLLHTLMLLLLVLDLLLLLSLSLGLCLLLSLLLLLMHLCLMHTLLLH